MASSSARSAAMAAAAARAKARGESKIYVLRIERSEFGIKLLGTFWESSFLVSV